MKKLSFPSKLLILCAILAFATTAHALSITPASSPQWSGIQTSQDVINGIIAPIIGTATELYKADVGEEGTGPSVIESGPLAGSYTTSFANSTYDPSDATISYDGGPYVGAPAFLLVKDGAGPPGWYLFDLTGLDPGGPWDGKENLELTGFWPNEGAISHVTLYGTQVPEPGTILLLGAGLIGLVAVSRRKFRK